MEIINQALADLVNYGAKVPAALIIILFGWLFVRFLQRMLSRVMLLARLDRTLISFVGAFVSFAAWVFLISLIFSVLGFPQISIAFSGSIALIILGIASNANSMIQDLLAGIFLIADPDFMVGKFVRVTTISGEVVAVDIKKTKVRDSEGNLHVISNKVFDANVFVIENPNQPTE